jgi:PHD/YefM family antitoxin component YafN of YafNO toxin-antitoxin module
MKGATTLSLPDKETLELLSIPGFLEECKEGLAEIRAGGGKSLRRGTEDERRT